MTRNLLENISPLREIALDGVRYALLRHNDQLWRLGSASPLWREEIAGLGMSPEEDALAALEARGIWISPASPPGRLAVMCGGLGSAWAGMGAELYANFPAARAAMNEIADLAWWDLPSLMLEGDLDQINQSRWQIPYLFMLEYGQWKQLRSLGLQPALMSGHSLGELTALCFAGVYDPDAAWSLFDTRAHHMQILEERADSPGAMLAISAPGEEISQVLAQWPELHVANRNTPRQFILSGPREPIEAARRSLRKRRIPAFMLSMNLAFHNPAMRILRDISYRRLYGLRMRKAAIPMLSCVKADLYPETQAEICKYITDLDENTVDWISSVNTMGEKFGISLFLELGPQEVLCGLVRELAPDSGCLYASRKNDEAMSMRRLCAALFAKGQLPFEKIEAEKNSRHALPEPSFYTREAGESSKGVAPAPELPGASQDDIRIVLNLLASASGRKASELGTNLDLRYDLGLRSSTFPLLAQRAEEELGRSISLEKMFPIATVGDLLRLFLGAQGEASETGEKRAHTPGAAPPIRPSLMTFSIEAGQPVEDCRPLPINPCEKSADLARDDLVALCIFDGELLPDLWRGLASIGLRLAIPAPLLDKCGVLRKTSSTLIPLECGCDPDGEELGEALGRLGKKYGAPRGIFLAEKPVVTGACQYEGLRNVLATLEEHLGACGKFASGFNDLPWLRIFQRYAPGGENMEGARNEALEKIREFTGLISRLMGDYAGKYQTINWFDERGPVFARNEPGDMLALEIFYGRARHALWKEGEKVYCASAPCLDFIFPDPHAPLPSQAGFFQGACQFSRFAFPQLSDHGGKGLYHPKFGEEELPIYRDCPWLPASFILGAMLNGAEMALPWLSVIAFADLEFGDAIGLPAGVTRECEIEARALYWVEMERSMSRLCRLALSTRKLTANGRRMDEYQLAGLATCQLAAFAPPPPALWEPRPWENAGLVSTSLIENFYRVPGYGRPWRMVGKFRFTPQGERLGPDFEAKLIPLKCSIDSGEKWGYKDFLHTVEGLIQTCALGLALGESGDARPSQTVFKNSLEKWRCRGIGFIRFDVGRRRKFPERGLRLEARRSWKDSSLARFDAQALTPDGKIFLTMHHLEFDRVGQPERCE